MCDIPVTYQQITDAILRETANPFELRQKTIKAIENKIGKPLVCYVMRTDIMGASIEEDDITGFSDLLYDIKDKEIGVFIISNGGSPSAAERIVKLIRSKYETVDFYVSGNAYSAATMMCFSADNIIMLNQGTLGPIDPQIKGVPAYAILSSFDEIKERLKNDGTSGIAVYMPLIAKYDLSLLELCRNAQDLSKELAEQYLSRYMFKDVQDQKNEKISNIVNFFVDYSIHKTHSRSIDRETAMDKGLNIVKAEEMEIDNLLLSLHNQYKIFLDRAGFFKVFENSKGINWGKEISPTHLFPSPIHK